MDLKSKCSHPTCPKLMVGVMLTYILVIHLKDYTTSLSLPQLSVYALYSPMASRYIREFLASEAFKNAGRDVSDVLPRLVKFLCCLQVTKTHLLTVTLSYGPSMLPTLGLASNLCLAERISTQFDKLGVGDIVLVQSLEVPLKFMTKRLIAMEGQSVTYVVDPKNSDKSETIVVPKGHVWIEGDNIYESNDSRKFGAVPYGLLQGRVFWRIWPPKDFGSLVQNKGKDSIS